MRLRIVEKENKTGSPRYRLRLAAVLPHLLYWRKLRCMSYKENGDGEGEIGETGLGR